MKFASTITLLAAIALMFQPTAKADDEGRALVGGLIGGLIIGSMLDNDHNHRVHTEVSYSRGRHHVSHHHSGYYKWVDVRVWVPGRYIYRYDDCGNRYRSWRRGHYTYDKKKVWVPYARSHGSYHRDYDRACDVRDRRRW